MRNNKPGVKKPTIQTIAEMVGVHKSTVSRVLNRKAAGGKVAIGDERTRQILQAARKLNYQPNVVAQALSRQKTKTIGAVGYLGSSYFYSMLLHAQQAAFEHGYILSVHGIDSYKSIEKALDDMFGLWQYDGIWAVGSGPEYQQPIVAHCAGRSLPLVFIGQPLGCRGKSNVKCIGGNLLDGFNDMVGRLVRLGHRKFAWFIPDVADNKLSELYLTNIKKALKLNNINGEYEVISIGQSMDQTRRATRKYFNDLKKNVSRDKWPTAAIAIFQTVGTLNGIHDAGLSVPGDISFITVDYSIESYGEALNPRVAVMYEPNEMFGKISIEKLIEMMEGNGGKKKSAFEHISLPLVFHEDESCKALRNTRGASDE
jgi:LacI family transcriptional regulator, galactose operon repressor